jgi:hypothetical protein
MDDLLLLLDRRIAPEDSVGAENGAPGEKATCWPVPEFPQNMDKTIGDLGLTNEQEDQIVAFLKTLTDGYKPQQAHKRK